MKLNELEIGKWYTSDNWAKGSFAKFLNSNGDLFNYSEDIYNDKWGERSAGRRRIWSWCVLKKLI